MQIKNKTQYIKRKNSYTITHTDIEKAFDKISYSFIINILTKLGIEAAHIHIIKTIYSNPTTNILLNREKAEDTEEILLNAKNKTIA